jgi:hypothetical protein
LEVKVQPLLIDRIKIQLTSPSMMMLSVDDTNCKVANLTKKDATQNASDYANLHINEIKEESRYRGKPVYWFVPEKFKQQRATMVSIQPYHAFPLWIFGNPTTFQKQEYIKKGFIDEKKNAQETRHEDNFIHTDICSLDPQTIEQDNMNYLPEMWHICEEISQEFLGYIPTDYEYPHIFRNPTIHIMEVNQDILTGQHDSVSVQMELIKYFLSPDGRDYLQQTNIRRFNTFEDYAHPGVAVQLDYGREGIVKIYPKTHHSLRVEATMYGNKHIAKRFGRKSIDLLDQIKNEMAKPLIDKLAIPQLLEEIPTPRTLTSFIFDHFIPDPIYKHIAKKLDERKYLFKHEIPPKLLRGKHRLFRAINHEGIWHYVLDPGLYGGER